MAGTSTGDWPATLQALKPAGTLQILGGDEVTLERMGHFTVVPFSGPLHPIRHYAADVLHPVWSITHPIRATVP